MRALTDDATARQPVSAAQLAEPPSADIAPALDGWTGGDGEGVLSARVILGSDHRPKLQMRVELGVLQMEVSGRPDGRGYGPGHDTRLDLLRKQFRGCVLTGKRYDFRINGDECRKLADEARLFARRSLAWFVLGDWQKVERDSRHALAAIEFAHRHATTPVDAAAAMLGLPYALTMKVRAEVSQLAEDGELRKALRLLDSTLRRLKRHYRRLGGRDGYAASNEVRVLKNLARKLKSRIPRSETRRLKRALDEAVEIENYEAAAVLRDRIRELARDKAAAVRA
jgi:hypothetical protein